MSNTRYIYGNIDENAIDKVCSENNRIQIGHQALAFNTVNNNDIDPNMQELNINQIGVTGSFEFDDEDNSCNMSFDLLGFVDVGDNILIKQSKYIPYQIGSSQLIICNVLPLAPIDTGSGYDDNIDNVGLVHNDNFWYRRWGSWDDERDKVGNDGDVGGDGHYFELYSFLDGISVRRQLRVVQVTGDQLLQVIEQEDWNIDTLDGNGPSGFDIDISQCNSYVIQRNKAYTLLGVYVPNIPFNNPRGGCRFIWCHKFNNVNQPNSTLKRLTLPLRFELYMKINTSFNVNINTLMLNFKYMSGAFYAIGDYNPLCFGKIYTASLTNAVNNIRLRDDYRRVTFIPLILMGDVLSIRKNDNIPNPVFNNFQGALEIDFTSGSGGEDLPNIFDGRNNNLIIKTNKLNFIANIDGSISDILTINITGTVFIVWLELC
jgi:hypothetical protein